MSIINYLSNVPDPRTKGYKILHKLSDILFISIAAVICGAEDWYEIEEYAKDKEAWLRTILELPSGIPSHDTFNQIFSILDSKALETCFMDWIKAVADNSEGRIVSIDGKRLCNGGEQGSRSVIHMVSAWCNHNQMVFCVVTIDAMGCQKEIASIIIQQQADYLLAVKDNQKHLHDDILIGA